MTSVNVVKHLLPRNFVFVREIIKGTYGRVDLVKNKDIENHYVAKTIHHEKFYKMERILIESPTFIHPNVVRGISHRKTSEFHQLIFEYCPVGDLFDFARRFDLTTERIIPIVGQLVKALMFFHSQGVVHGDVKAENILICKISPIRVKLADFGLSFYPPYSDYARRGTYEFMSPEMISYRKGKGQPVSFPTDMWSLGVFVYELVYNELPFGSRNDSKESLGSKICDAKFKFPSGCPDIKDFISRLLVREPRARMTAKQCLEHPLLKEWYREDLVKDVIRRHSAPPGPLE